MATLRNGSQTSEKRIEGLESQVALVTKNISYFAIFVRDHGSEYLCLRAENGEVGRRVNEVVGNPLKTVSFADQNQENASAMTLKRDALVANSKELVWSCSACLVWPKKRGVDVHVYGSYEKRPNQMRRMCRLRKELRTFK